MLHPAVSLFLWGLLAILAQLLPAVALCAYAAVCAAVALLGKLRCLAASQTVKASANAWQGCKSSLNALITGLPE